MFLAIDLGLLTWVNYIFYVIIGIAILAGFAKGLKKTIYTFIVMAIFYIAFFLTIDQAVQILWTMDMSWAGEFLGGIDPALAGFTSFEDSLGNLLGAFVGGDINIDTASAEVLGLATGLAQFIIKIIWTVLYFSVVLVIWKLLTWIIALIFVKNKNKESKNRGLGAVFGILNGAMAIFVMMIVLGGLMSVVDSTVTLVSNTTVEELSYAPRFDEFNGSYTIIPMAETSELDMDAYVEDLQAMVDAYDNNPIVKLVSGITTQSTINPDVEVPLHIDLFDKVLSFEYNEAKIGIRYELSVFSSAGSVLLQSDFIESGEITDITGDEIRDVFSYLSESTLIVSLIPVAIELAADMYGEDLPIPVEELYDIDYETELANLGAIAGALFDILNGAGFIGGEGSVDQIEIDGDAVRDLFDDIAGSEVIVLMTESLLLPMLEDSEGEFSAIITVPEDLDIEAELLAIGEICAEIIDADISFSDFEEADVSILLDAASQIDFTILLESQIVTEALINILSGETTIEGLDMLSIPDDVVWRDVYVGDVLTEPGELRYILEAINVLANVAEGLDFDNLDVTTLTDLEDEDITTLFTSYIIRATISDIISDTNLGDVPLVIPDSVYDTAGYFTQAELENVLKAVKLILVGAGEEFDIVQALSLTSTEIDTLLASEILAATIGYELYDLGSSSLVVPADTVTTVLVDAVAENVITEAEIKNILLALSVLDISDFDTMSFDAGIMDSLENTAGDDLDDTKIATLLGSSIVQATVSDMILGLDQGSGGVLLIPDADASGNTIKYYDAGNALYMITDTEIGNILKALYGINITDFNSIDLEDTSLLLDNLSSLLLSGIIHATVSDIILDMTGTVTIPEKDVDNSDVLIIQGTVTFISADELDALVTAMDALSILDPTAFTTGFDLSILADSGVQDTVLDSAIMHATISETLFDVGGSILLVPLTDEDGDPIRVERGSVGNEVEYIVKDEIKAMINVFNEIGLDLDDLGSGISTGDLLDNPGLLLASSSLQATISDRILSSLSGNLIVPDEDELDQDIRIEQTDVTYIRNSELEDFITSINLLGVTDFDTFDMSPSDIFTVDLNIFFESYIMQATVSKYVLDQADYEEDPYSATALVVPHALREDIEVETVSTEQVEKSELINIINSLQALGMNNFTDDMNITSITGLDGTTIDTVLVSGSFHVTIDRMLRQNANVIASIPALAVEVAPGLYGVDPITKASAIRNFIVAVNTFGADNFTTFDFDLAAVGALTNAERNIVLNSMIVRNKITPALVALDIADPTYTIENTDYEQDDPLLFLDHDGAYDALAHFYPA